MPIANGIRQLMNRLDRRALLEPLLDLCREYNVTPEEILAKARTKRVVEARDAFISQLYRRKLSEQEIANLLHMDRGNVHCARHRHAARSAPPVRA